LGPKIGEAQLSRAVCTSAGTALHVRSCSIKDQMAWNAWWRIPDFRESNSQVNAC